MKRYLACCFVLFLLFIPQKSYSQDNLQVIGELQYAQWDGKWYIAVNGERGAKVDTNHIVAHLKNNRFIENLDFTALGVPGISVARGRIGPGFYKLRIFLDNIVVLSYNVSDN